MQLKPLLVSSLTAVSFLLPASAEAHSNRHHHGRNHHGHVQNHRPRNPNRCHWHPNKGVGHCHSRNQHGPRPAWYPFVYPNGFEIYLDF